MKANPKGGGLPNMRELAPWRTVAEDVASGFAYLNVRRMRAAISMGWWACCWGGEMKFAAATQIPTLDAAVVFYGRSPDPLDLVKVHRRRGPLNQDRETGERLPDTIEAMKNTTDF